jgi:hypothetical protein
METRVWVFFYGSYINREVLKEVELVPASVQVAKLAGFDIQIAPRANLVRSPRERRAPRQRRETPNHELIDAKPASG